MDPKSDLYISEEGTGKERDKAKLPDGSGSIAGTGKNRDDQDESEKEAFTCPSCGKKTRLNPKGCDRIFCYYCGKKTERL